MARLVQSFTSDISMVERAPTVEAWGKKGFLNPAPPTSSVVTLFGSYVGLSTRHPTQEREGMTV